MQEEKVLLESELASVGRILTIPKTGKRLRKI